ncbi:MAG: hypothetical protein ABJB32_07685 [Verrucomicrobiota bacterium]
MKAFDKDSAIQSIDDQQEILMLGRMAKTAAKSSAWIDTRVIYWSS